MIPKECKRLAEVDFPIAEVSRHAAREKSIRHGHPSTLHLWWARRPLASSRAVLMTLLLPDPCDPLCPGDFRQAAVREIKRFAVYVTGTKVGSEQLVADLKSDLRSRNREKKQAAQREANRRDKAWRNIADTTDWTPPHVRAALLQLVASGSSWDLSSDETFLRVARNLVKAVHPEDTPLVVDPFAGGGSIPLEALRLGCETFASDLNPVACLILKVMLEDIPRYGPGLADELRRVGAEIKAKAEEELADLYPADPDGATPIAYLWARTVRCEAPNCGAEIPLMRSLWLCRKPNRKWALRTNVTRPVEGPPQVEFEIFEPGSNSEVQGGTVTRAKATCVCCGSVLPPDRVRSQLAAQKGGADAVFHERGNRTGGARMTAVVTLRPGEKGRHYRLPTTADYAAVRLAQERVANLLDEWELGGRQGLCPVPDEPTPIGGGSGAGRAFSVRQYGMFQWRNLFTARQLIVLNTLSRLIRVKSASLSSAIVGLLALAVGKSADLGNAASPWKRDAECPVNLLGSQRIRPPWEWGEAVTTSKSSGSFWSAVNRSADAVESALHFQYAAGTTILADATDTVLPLQTASAWFTDPPYYDAIPYAGLADFFFAWFRRILPNHPLLRDPFDSKNPLTPKVREIIEDGSEAVDGQLKDQRFFENRMALTFHEGRRVLKEDGIGSVVFAHKTTEGWEALLSGMIRGGWIITGSWPVATEMAHRPRARESAALATSVHLICRPRPDDAPVGDWSDVLQELPRRVGDWMERLQGEGIRGADLVFACVGPALEVFSRYRQVETAEGDEIRLPEYLERVWEVVGRAALEQVLGTAEARARNGALGALEEDARLTALFLWTMQSTAEGSPSDNGAGADAESSTAARRFTLPFDVVRRFAQPLGITLPDWETRIIKTQKGVVRLMPVTDRGEQLFGEAGAHTIADQLESSVASAHQLSLFPDSPPTVRGRSRRRRDTQSVNAGEIHTVPGATTLDRVHAAMLLQASGRTDALRNLLQAEQERGSDFLRLANALSALYPRRSQEKRLLDGMLAAPR